MLFSLLDQNRVIHERFLIKAFSIISALIFEFLVLIVLSKAADYSKIIMVFQNYEPKFCVKCTQMLKPWQRREKILEILRGAYEMPVNELISKLEGSPASLRRDLRILEARGLISRKHGIVKLNLSLWHPSNLERKLSVCSEEKKRIAKAVVSLIKEGEVLFFDTGSTVLYVARELRNHKGLMVITNSLPVARELGAIPHIKVIMTGGIYQHDEQCLVGSMAEQGIRSYKASKAVIGADGFTAAEGVTSHDPENAGVTRAMVERAGEVIVVADYRKIGVRGVVPIVSAERVDILVTNCEADQEEIRALEAKGVRVILS